MKNITSVCKRRKLFSWMSPKTEVRETEKIGRGVFAVDDIKENELVSAVGGYVMTLEEFGCLSEEMMHYPSQICEEMVLGVKNPEEIDDAYYFNHSCEPNIGYGGQLFFRAMRKIKKGEELTFDYAMELFPSQTETPEDKPDFEEYKCLCGKRGCRKLITEYDWEIPELQEKYDGYFSWFIQEKIDIMRGRRNYR